MFTVQAARALEPGAHLTVDGAPGLRLVATDTLRTWTYRFKSPVDGRMRQLKLGHWPAMSVSAALAAWGAAKTQRGTGVDPAQQRRADRAATGRAGTVRAVCDDYLEAHRHVWAPKTWAELDRLFTRELGGLDRVPAATLTRAHAFDLLQAMRDRPVVARRLRQGLGAAWDHALDAGRLPPDAANWWRLVLRGKLPSRGYSGAGVVKRVLTEAEVGALLQWMPNFSRDVQDVLTLYLWTCCRGAEIVQMDRAEVTREPDGVWWTIPKAKLKMRRNPLTVDLRVPLVGRALAVVMRRMDAHTGRWLFPTTSRSSTGHIAQKAAGVAVYWHMPDTTIRPESVRPRLPVAGWAPHDLRRTGRTVLAAMGCPDPIAEAVLGHMQPGVYNRHTYDAERRQWLTALSERWESL